MREVACLSFTTAVKGPQQCGTYEDTAPEIWFQRPQLPWVAAIFAAAWHAMRSQTKVSWRTDGRAGRFETPLGERPRRRRRPSIRPSRRPGPRDSADARALAGMTADLRLRRRTRTGARPSPRALLFASARRRSERPKQFSRLPSRARGRPPVRPWALGSHPLRSVGVSQRPSSLPPCGRTSRLSRDIRLSPHRLQRGRPAAGLAECKLAAGTPNCLFSARGSSELTKHGTPCLLMVLV